MKCPKCQYLGFETGQRCRNCGYDFSLLSLADTAAAADLLIRPAEQRDVPGGLPSGPPALSNRARQATPELPLFPGQIGDDEPLITVAPAPRPPLAVRRTPELPRTARAPRVVRREEGPRLDRVTPQLPTLSGPPPAPGVPVRPDPPVRARPAAAPPGPLHLASCGPKPRVCAAVIDLAILLALDIVVVYLTLRMAGLGAGEWSLLPLVPMGSFLLAVTLAYFSAFTAVGGQTIGKMALHLRVVADDDGLLRPARAVGRSVVAAASMLPLGAGFVPALFDGGRALHDRVTRTRVVSVHPVAPA